MNKKWDKVGIAWLIIALVIVISTIIYKHIVIVDSSISKFLTIISDLSAIFGVVYVICAARQERKAYPFGMANVILYAIVVYSKGLYISAGYNLLYSLPVLIYGYIYWGKLEKNGDTEVRQFSFKKKIIGIFLMCVGVIVLALFSEKFLDGTNVWMDSITSVCVCVATFLMARKYIEQWLLFIIANFMGVILFFPKSFADMLSIDLFAMWVVYFVNSIYGYVSWKKSLKGENS